MQSLKGCGLFTHLAVLLRRPLAKERPLLKPVARLPYRGSDSALRR